VDNLFLVVVIIVLRHIMHFRANMASQIFGNKHVL